MRRAVLVFALLVCAAAAVSAIPMIHRTYTDGWMYMGIGASVSIPDFKLSPLFELEVGGPEQFGMTLTMMFGNRVMFTLGAFYLLDPSPGSLFAIPIMLKVGVIDMKLFGDFGLDFGMALSSGLRVYALQIGDISSTDGGMHLTADAEASVYWNFGNRLSFSLDAYPGIIFSLVETGSYYIYY